MSLTIGASFDKRDALSLSTSLEVRTYVKISPRSHFGGRLYFRTRVGRKQVYCLNHSEMSTRLMKIETNGVAWQMLEAVTGVAARVYDIISGY